MPPRGGFGFTALLLAVSVTFLVLTLDFDQAAQAIPLAVAALLSALLLVQAVRDLRARNGAAMSGRGEAAVPRQREAGAVGWLLSLGAMVLLIGAFLGSALFVVLYLRRTGRERWAVSLAAGATTAVVFWLTITRVIGAQIPFGWIGALVWP